MVKYIFLNSGLKKQEYRPQDLSRLTEAGNTPSKTEKKKKKRSEPAFNFDSGRSMITHTEK